MSAPQRSPLVVNRAQARLFGRNLLYYAPCVLLLGGALVGASFLVAPQEGREPSQLEALLLSLRATVWSLAALAALVFVLHSLFLAHRVLGPLVRFHRAFREINAGHLAQRILLRPKDYHVEEALAFNVMMDTLSARLHRIKARHDQAELQLKEAEEALAAGGDALPRLRSLRAELARCDEEWAWFDLPPRTIELHDAQDSAPPARRAPAPPHAPRPARA